MDTVHKAYLADMTPDEVEVLTGKPATGTEAAANAEEVAAAAGGEDLDDGTDTTGTEGEVASDATSNEGESAEVKPVGKAEAADALAELEPEAKPAATEAPKAFEVPADDFDKKRTELRTQKREVHTKWANGELSDTEYFEQTDQLDDQIAEVITAQSKKTTLADINAQNEARVREAQAAAEDDAMAKVAASSKAAGQIDYSTDQVACAQFDAAFNAVRLDPANATLSPLQVAEKAHTAVLALRGIAPAPAPAPAAAGKTAAPAPKPTVPPSLSSMPAAAAQPIGADPMDDIMAIEDPDVREARWAALTPQARAQALRSTVPAARGRH